MLNRYQIGPVATVVFFMTLVLLCAYGLYVALAHHRWNGWLIALTALLSFFNFHKRFARRDS
jgi:hypothetical protein